MTRHEERKARYQTLVLLNIDAPAMKFGSLPLALGVTCLNAESN